MEQTDEGSTVVQSWVSESLAEELRARAEAERRSVSSTIRLAIEDLLANRRVVDQQVESARRLTT